MNVQSYRDLIVWQKGVDLVAEIYPLTESFPKSQMFSLALQIQKAAVSVPSNIAEGQGRSTTKDYLNFLHIARGSLQELETQLFIAHRLKYTSEAVRDAALAKTMEIGRLLNGLIRSLASPNADP